MLRRAGLAYAHRTRPGGPDGADGADGADSAHADVIILDTMGELAAMYAAADMAFVGATLVPLGGHNCWNPRHAAYPSCSVPIPRTSGRVRRPC